VQSFFSFWLSEPTALAAFSTGFSKVEQTGTLAGDDGSGLKREQGMMVAPFAPAFLNN